MKSAIASDDERELTLRKLQGWYLRDEPGVDREMWVFNPPGASMFGFPPSVTRETLCEAVNLPWQAEHLTAEHCQRCATRSEAMDLVTEWVREHLQGETQ